MNSMSYSTLRDSIRSRIVEGEWKPGGLIPAEEELASEYGCSRTTVNRALQALADVGMIERKRRAGTRVAIMPAKRAQLEISVIRYEVEAGGAKYSHRLMLKKVARTPAYVRERLHLSQHDKALHLQTLHLADGRPHAFEDRWINIEAAPHILNAPLDDISANEWLVREIPYTSGEIAFAAEQIGKDIAEIMEVPAGSALMTLDRTTWLGDTFVTTMKLYFKPDYSLKSTL